jgi:hypothetical protein
MQNKQATSGRLYVQYATPLFIIAINYGWFVGKALLLYTFGLLLNLWFEKHNQYPFVPVCNCLLSFDF